MMHAPMLLAVAALQAAAPTPDRPTFTVKPGADGSPAPSLQDLYKQLYPPKALAAGVDGEASVRCDTSATTGFSNCALLSEAPSGYGFGAASLQFLARVLPPPGKLKDGGSVVLPVRWRTRSGPMPVGTATMTCTVTVQGTLKDCRIVSEDPPGRGVGQAELKSARLFKAKPAMQDGKPVESLITIPMRFQVDETPAAPSPNLPSRPPEPSPK